MSQYLDKIKEYLQELDFIPVHENVEEELVVVEDEERGIKNLVIDCEYPILVLEQLITEMPQATSVETYKRILQMNRELVHGAFVLDDSAKILLFRDTLQLENLDLNEIQASINALSLAMAEYSAELLKFAKA